ncbi:MAG: hypothetical protein OEY29_10795 [Gammaproteobacteria bacterium]|nr:hypothetical protein [Gammaproteobacteria bacterium]
MSGIQLSDALIEDVKKAIKQHDYTAGDDMVAVQYMAASIGYFMSALPDGQFDKKQVLSQLAEFSLQVFDQMEADKKPKEEAYGVWKPGS